jgi:hypothetical protein
MVMRNRRRFAVVLCLTVLAVALVPQMSLAAGRRGSTRLAPAESVFTAAAHWAVRVWEAVTGLTPATHSRLAGASGIGYDPQGCDPAPCTSSVAPPPPQTAGDSQ